MIDPEQINADQLAFWNGQGGHTWVARQEHTDITLAPMTEALLAFAAPCPAIFLSTLFFRGLIMRVPSSQRKAWIAFYCLAFLPR